MKVYLTKKVNTDFYYALIHKNDNNNDIFIPENFIQVSEVMDIDFAMLEEKETCLKEIAFLDKQIEYERAESESKVNVLLQRKQELLAIGVEK